MVTYIHSISFEYEYVGSTRTPVTKSSTYKRPHRILVLLYTRSKYPTQLAKMSFDEILDLTADVFYFIIIARETIHDCSYTRERIMSSVSPYSSILWVTATISITACVQQMVPETRKVYSRRPRVEACGTW